jgi:hypothetical protein
MLRQTSSADRPGQKDVALTQANLPRVALLAAEHQPINGCIAFAAPLN